MNVKPDILEAFCNTEIVIDWHEHEHLVPFFMEALEEYRPDITWSDGRKPSDRPLSCGTDTAYYLNYDQENEHIFSDDDTYLELELSEIPIIPIIHVFDNTEPPDYSHLLDLL